jgi:hypothetical protein
LTSAVLAGSSIPFDKGCANRNGFIQYCFMEMFVGRSSICHWRRFPAMTCRAAPERPLREFWVAKVRGEAALIRPSVRAHQRKFQENIVEKSLPQRPFGSQNVTILQQRSGNRT